MWAKNLLIILSWLVLSFVPLSLAQAGQAEQGDSTPPSTPGTPSDGGSVTSSTSATWTWTAAADSQSGISTYKIDIGTTPGGINIANQVSTSGALSYTQTGLADGQTYYARVRAVNGAGLTGDYSGNSDGILVDTSAPTFSSLGVSTTSSTATITWTTSEPATTQIHYGTSSGSYPLTTTLSSSLVTSHSATISSLSPGTYYYQALSNDGVGNGGTSSQASFTIDAPPASATPTPTPSATVTTSSPASASPSATSTTTQRATPSASASVAASPSVPTPSPTVVSESSVPNDQVTILASTAPAAHLGQEQSPTPQTTRSWPGWLTLLLLTIGLLFLLGLFLWLHRRHPEGDQHGRGKHEEKSV